MEGLALAHYGRAIGDAADDTAVLKKPAAKGLSLKKQPALPQKRKSKAKPLKKPAAASKSMMKRPAAAHKALVAITR